MPEKNLLIGWLLVLLSLCPQIKADVNDDLAAAQKRQVELEQENAKLRKRVQALESQVAQGPATAPAAAIASMSPTTRPAATQPAGPQTFPTILAVLECLPADARPDGKAGWETLHKDHAELWFANHLKNARFDGQLKVSMSRGPKMQVTVDGVKKYEYSINVYFDAPSAEYAGITIDPHFSYRLLKGDERLFEAAGQFAKPIETRVTGLIKSFNLGAVTHGQCRVDLSLNEFKIHSSLLPD